MRSLAGSLADGVLADSTKTNMVSVERIQVFSIMHS